MVHVWEQTVPVTVLLQAGGAVQVINSHFTERSGCSSTTASQLGHLQTFELFFKGRCEQVLINECTLNYRDLNKEINC